MKTRFYEQRHLPAPSRQLSPKSREQLTKILDDLRVQGARWRLFGSGEHIRMEPDQQADDVVAVHSGELNDVLEVDPHSNVVRVEAGIQWNELQAAVGERDLSLQRYGLHPASATIGGMLARNRPGPPMLRGGALLDGCIAIGAHRPDGGDYRYLAAPRKASGPDLRHVFIGAEGSGGAILDATLVVWPPVASRLVRFEDCSPVRAAHIVTAVHEASITPSWVHYRWPSATLQFQITAPGQLLRTRMSWLTNQLGTPESTGDREDARTRRQWLESRHPDRRSHPDAENTRIFWMKPAALTEDPADLFGEGIEEVEIPQWTPRRARVFVRYDDPQRVDDNADAPPEGTYWATRALV